MSYADEVPLNLLSIQKWFAGIITKASCQDNDLIDAPLYVVPSATLSPEQRILIYQQNYWLRLLKALHENFLSLACLLGYSTFDQMIGIPYIEENPPDHWSMALIGRHLPEWIEKHYWGSDKELVTVCAQLDRAYLASFLSPQLPSPVDYTERLYLQPHVRLFDLKLPAFSFREQLISKSPDFWESHPLPEYPEARRGFFILFRHQNNNAKWLEISETKYSLLRNFQNGVSIEEICLWLEQQENHIYEEVTKHLQLWFQQWTMYGWFTLDKQNDEFP